MADLILTAGQNCLLNQCLQTFIDNPSQNICLRKHLTLCQNAVS